MHNQLIRIWKFLASFRTSAWELSDYPVRVQNNPGAASPGWPPPDSHLKMPKYYARILGWWTMTGLGETPEEAVAELRKRFEAHRAAGKRPPRPGVEHADIEFASAERMALLEDVAPKFFREILEMEFEDCLVTDESSLWDFHADANNEGYFRRIEEIYGVNVRDLENGNLADILERLKLLSSRI